MKVMKVNRKEEHETPYEEEPYSIWLDTEKHNYQCSEYQKKMEAIYLIADTLNPASLRQVSERILVHADQVEAELEEMEEWLEKKRMLEELEESGEIRDESKKRVGQGINFKNEN